MRHQMLASQISPELFSARREKALWVTLWGWKFHVRVQSDLSRKSWMSEGEMRKTKGRCKVGSKNGSQDTTELAQMDSHLLLSLAQEPGGRDIGIANQASRSLT